MCWICRWLCFLFQVGDLEIFLMMIQSSGAYMQTLLAVLEGSPKQPYFGYYISEIKMNYWSLKFLTYHAAFSIWLHRCILPISCHWHLSEILPRYCTALLCRLRLIDRMITSGALLFLAILLHICTIAVITDDEYSTIYMMWASKQAVARGLKDPSNRVIQNHFAVEGNLGEIAAKVIFKCNFCNQTSHT